MTGSSRMLPISRDPLAYCAPGTQIPKLPQAPVAQGRLGIRVAQASLIRPATCAPAYPLVPNPYPTSLAMRHCGRSDKMYDTLPSGKRVTFPRDISKLLRYGSTEIKRGGDWVKSLNTQSACEVNTKPHHAVRAYKTQHCGGAMIYQCISGFDELRNEAKETA